MSSRGWGLLLSHPLTSTSRKLPQLGHEAAVLPPGGRPCALQVARAWPTRGPGLQRGPRLAGTRHGTALLVARIAVDGEWVPFHECTHHQRAAFGRVLPPRMPRLVQILPSPSASSRQIPPGWGFSQESVPDGWAGARAEVSETRRTALSLIPVQSPAPAPVLLQKQNRAGSESWLLLSPANAGLTPRQALSREAKAGGLPEWMPCLSAWPGMSWGKPSGLR